MRFVPVKDTEQQSVLMLHRARCLLVRQRTILVNELRAYMRINSCWRRSGSAVGLITVPPRPIGPAGT
jgi:transposase